MVLAFLSAPHGLLAPRPASGRPCAHPARVASLLLSSRWCGGGRLLPQRARRTRAVSGKAAPQMVGGPGALLHGLLVAPLFEPVNGATPEWLRYVVWIDFRLAVALFVLYPLGLFVASMRVDDGDDAVRRVMVGYWQASSLLLLTVLLNISEQPVGTFTGMLVQALIIASLWWWQDLSGEIERGAASSTLKRAFLRWRVPATALATCGTAAQLASQRCNFVPSLTKDAMCGVWLEPPFNFHRLLIPFAPTSALKLIAYAGVSVYLSYLAYYVAVPLPRVGRKGRKERHCFSSVSVLARWRWLTKPPLR